jgi:sulfopyruvate decarboxylase TPP-binding subunit
LIELVTVQECILRDGGEMQAIFTTRAGNLLSTVPISKWSNILDKVNEYEEIYEVLLRRMKENFKMACIGKHQTRQDIEG